MAEGIFNKIAKERGIDAIADSVGCATYGGDGVSENSLVVCREIGVDLSEHRSKGLTVEAVENADIIVPMGDSHYHVLKYYFPNQEGILPALGVPDPYGSDEDVYRECRDQIVKGLEDIADKI